MDNSNTNTNPNKNLVTLNDKEYQSVNIESLMTDSNNKNEESNIYDEESNRHIGKKNIRPLFSGPSKNVHNKPIKNDNNSKNEEVEINISSDNSNVIGTETPTHQDMKKCNSNHSCHSCHSCHSRNSSNDSHFKYQCSNSSSEIKALNPEESECDIINSNLYNTNNFCSSETIVERGNSSNSFHDTIYNEKKDALENDEIIKNDMNNADNILFINDAYSINEDTNLNYHIQNDIMTTMSTSSTGSNNFNDIMREELEPTHTAWNTWRSWCLIKILSSLLILLFGVKAFIMDYGKDCVQGFKFFAMSYNVVAIIQITINLLLIVYLPHKIFQINYEMHRRLFISKILWAFQGFIDIVQLIMIPIAIKLLKGTPNICYNGDISLKSSSYSFIYYVTLISSCVYIFMVILLLVVPCWTLFMLLPKYEGVSMSQFKKINTIEVTKEIIEQESFCVICMEPFKLKTKVKQLPCKHIYHKNCISIWFAEHNKCPTCRYEID